MPRKKRHFTSFPIAPTAAAMGGLTWALDASFTEGGGGGPRLGVLTTPGAPGATAPTHLPTPALLTYTRRGEPAHLTPDVVDLLPPEARAFQVSLVHFMDHLGPDHVANTPGGGRKYFGCKPTLMLATPRDPITFDMVGRRRRFSFSLRTLQAFGNRHVVGVPKAACT